MSVLQNRVLFVLFIYRIENVGIYILIWSYSKLKKIRKRRKSDTFHS